MPDVSIPERTGAVIRRAAQVDALYLLFLGRRPESGGIDASNFGRPVLDLAEAIVSAREFREEILNRFIERGTLAHDALGREALRQAVEIADAAGLASLALSRFGPQAYFAVELAPFDGAAFVSAAYRLILARAPDAEGARHYLERLAAGSLSKRQIAAELMGSNEFRARGRPLQLIGSEGGAAALVPFGWRSVLHEVFRAGPLAQILERHHGRAAERFVAALNPAPVDLILSVGAPPGIGGLDAVPVRDRLWIEGWALARDGVAAIEIAAGETSLAAAQYGLRRADVAARFADWSDSEYSGFAAMIPAAALPADGRAVRVILRDRAGKAAVREFFVEIAANGGEDALPQAPGEPEKALYRRLLAGLDWRPVFCLVLLLDPEEEAIAAGRTTLAALRDQSYPDWHLLVVVRERRTSTGGLRDWLIEGDRDLASLRAVVVGDGHDLATVRDRLLDGFDDVLGRVEVVPGAGKRALGETGANRRAGRRSSLFVPLHPGDRLSPDALFEFAAASGMNRAAEAVTGDMVNGKTPISCVRGALLERVGGGLDDLVRLGPARLVQHCCEQSTATCHLSLRLCERVHGEPIEEVAAAASPARDGEGLKIWLDRPLLIDNSAPIAVRANLQIEGWALARAGVASVDIAIDGERIHSAHYGLRRPDIGTAYPDWPDAARSGFSAQVPRRKLPTGRHAVQVVLRDRDGEIAQIEFAIAIDEAIDDGFLPLRRKISQAELDLHQDVLSGLGWQPAFRLMLLLGRGDGASEAARKTLASLREQAYSRWRLLVVLCRGEPDAALPPHSGGSGGAATGRQKLLDGFEEISEKIEILDEAGAIPLAEIMRVSPAADFFGILGAGDELGCDALLEFAAASGMRRDADLFYCDERRVSPASRLVEPFLKPRWSPDLLLSTNYIGRFWCATAGVLERSAVTLDEFRRLGEYDLLLRATEKATAIVHLPKVLCQRAGERLDGAERERQALKAAMSRRGIAGEIHQGCVAGTYRLRRALARPGLVSIIIPTCASRGLVKTCIETLRRLTAYRYFEIIAIDNIPDHQPDWKSWLSANADKVVEIREPFNWSRFSNRAAAEAAGEFLLFLNDDIEITEADWLDALLEHGQRPEVGVVGPQLLYPDLTVQHAGIFLSPEIGRARHAFRYAPADDPQYFGLALTERDVIAVTGACLLTRREVFDRLAGFDEAHRVVNNDLDYCLKARRRGLSTVFTPHSRLIHHELASRGAMADDYGADAFAEQWRAVFADGDPYHHPDLSKESDCFVPEEEPLRLVCPGPPLARPEAIRNILLVKLDHIGDCLTALPAVRRLQARFPDARLRVLAGQWSRPVWSLLKGIEEVIDFGFFNPRTDARMRDVSEVDLAVLRRRLEPYRLDLAVDLRKHPETRHILQFTGARYTAGFDHRGRFPWLDIAIEWDGDAERTPKRHHVSDDLVHLADAVIAACEPGRAVLPGLVAGPVALAEGAQRRLFARRVVCVHPACGDPLRQWPAAHFAELIDLLVEREAVNIALIGVAGDEAIGAQILDRVRSASAISNLIGALKLEELPNLMLRCALFVGNNSGPHHLAAGLGVPTIGIHSGLVDAREWGPVGPRGVALRREMACGPCYIPSPAHCPRGLACLTGLRADEVYAVCRRLLAIGFAGAPNAATSQPAPAD